MTTKKITLKAWADNNEVITAVQGEVNSRFLEITLIDNDGALNLENKSVQIYAKKPDGNIIYNNAEIIDATKGIISIMLTSEMSAVSGIMSDCEIRVIDKQAVTLKFKGLHIIIKSALSDKAVESSSEFTALQELIASADAHQKSKNNPHSVTAEQVGAAKVNHTHSFNSLTYKPNSLSGYGITDAATSDQGDKADSAIQLVKVNGKSLTADWQRSVNITTNNLGVVPNIDAITVVSDDVFNNVQVTLLKVGKLVFVKMPTIDNFNPTVGYSQVITVPEDYRPISDVDEFRACTPNVNINVICGTNGALCVVFLNRNQSYTFRLGPLMWITE